MLPARLWLLRLFLTAVGMLLALLLVEVGLRAFGPPLLEAYGPRLGLRLDRHYEYMEPHPIFGSFHVPGATSRLMTGEFITRVDINSRGLRDREAPYEKPGGVRRVMVLGDSFVEAAQVPEEAMLTRRLQAFLNDGSRQPVEVLNAGVIGYSTAQEYLLLKHELLRYRPDLIVLVFYVGNDVAENSPAIDARPTPYFVLEGGDLRQLPFRYQPRSPRRWRDRLRGETLLFFHLENGYANARAWLRHTIRGGRGGEPGEEPAEEYWARTHLPVFFDRPVGPWIEAWSVTEALLVALRDEAAAGGAEFLVLNAPAGQEIYPAYWRESRAVWDSIAERAGLPAATWDLDAPERRLLEIALRHDLAYVDLRPALRGAESRGLLYFPYDGHWTALGHEVAARALLEPIRQRLHLD